MPLADYRCPGCPSVVVRDHYFAMAVGAVASAPVCEVCECLMEWIPQCQWDMKTDGDGDRGFQKFTVHRQVPTRDGLVQQAEVVDSLHKLRQIERDSEQRFRNGEGEPLRFRGYANNRSNLDVGSFGREGEIGGIHYDSGKTPTKRFGVKRHAEEPAVETARIGGVTALEDR